MPGKAEDTTNRLRLQIQAGKYGQKGCLPTMEGLAREFEVSKGVIVKAIGLLQGEGLLTTIGKRITVGHASAKEADTSFIFKVGEPTIGLTPRGNQQYYDYLLSFPEGLQAPDGQDLSGIVFYVGKGTWYKPSLIQRIDMHEHEAKQHYYVSMIGAGANGFKVKAIRYIWAAGKNVAKCVIFETLNEREAIEAEKAAIKLHWNPYLTNHENYAHCKVGEWPNRSR